ncbi:hypothetical protein LSTR_LSTR008761 [Laodelphax striatellus]|uniref:Retrotransposon gag domain-containing protein n=1 Tax=Laodelphax striatellus TaxID=195883 RepID=A0A482XQZ0_LAOST|nr:hypothetical protein LSTR_LSTR008761 [Laodelphax striatellus]
MDDHHFQVMNAAFMNVRCLMDMVNSIHQFSGEVKELPLFLERMDSVHSQIMQNNFDDVTMSNLHSYFLSRIDTSVLLEIGVSFSATWEDVKKALKERYAGARTPVAASVLKLLELSPDSGESIFDFTKRMAQYLKRLKSKVLDSCPNNDESNLRNRVYDELAMEALTNKISTQLQTTIKIAKPKNFEEAVALIRDDI